MVGEKVKIALVVSAYFIISISMVFMNKFLLNRDDSIPAPFFITWYQCVLTALIDWALGLVGKSTPKNSCLSQFPQQKYNLTTAIRILPLSAIFVGMITFNNLCLKFVNVSFYLVARSLTIVFNVLLTYLLLGVKTSLTVIGCCLIVIFGFFIGSDGEMNFSLRGTLFGVMSSLFVSLNSIYTKKMIPIVENNSWKLSFYNNMNASILFIPLIYFFEHDIILSHWSSFKSATFWSVMTAAGVFGFLIGIVTIAQISLTSPLTHNISGTAKASVQTIIAVLFFGDKMNFRSALGTILVLTGTFLYSLVRSMEMDREKARKKMEAEDALIREQNNSEEMKYTEDKPLLRKFCVCCDYMLMNSIDLSRHRRTAS